MNPKDIKENTDLQEGIPKAIDMANKKLQSRNSCNFILSKIIQATSQVVQGISYDVEIEMAPKDKSGDCKLSNGCPNGLYVCKFNVWARDWLKDPAKQLIVSEPVCKCEMKQFL